MTGLGDQTKIHYFDESAFRGALLGRGRMARSLPGQRVACDMPAPSRKNNSLLAITCLHFGEPKVLWELRVGGVKGADVAEFLTSGAVADTFQWGDILVLDNCSGHHAETEVALEKLYSVLGVHVVFLPAYHPYINGIEFMFGWIKNQLSHDDAYYRTDDRLLSLTTQLLESVDERLMISFYKQASKELDKEMAMRDARLSAMDTV